MDSVELMIKEFLEHDNSYTYIVLHKIKTTTVVEQKDGDYHVMIDTVKGEFMVDTVTKTQLLVWLWEKSK